MKVSAKKKTPASIQPDTWDIVNDLENDTHKHYFWFCLKETPGIQLDLNEDSSPFECFVSCMQLRNLKHSRKLSTTNLLDLLVNKWHLLHTMVLQYDAQEQISTNLPYHVAYRWFFRYTLKRKDWAISEQTFGKIPKCILSLRRGFNRWNGSEVIKDDGRQSSIILQSQVSITSKRMAYVIVLPAMLSISLCTLIQIHRIPQTW